MRLLFHIQVSPPPLFNQPAEQTQAAKILPADFRKMEFQEKRLYHQIHPLKLATDVSSAVASLYFLWNRRILWAALVAFVPPILVSSIMITGFFDLEWLKHSSFGRYVRLHMTPAVEAIRLLTLIPMAYGAWTHDFRFIAIGCGVLIMAWGHGLIRFKEW